MQVTEICSQNNLPPHPHSHPCHVQRQGCWSFVGGPTITPHGSQHQLSISIANACSSCEEESCALTHSSGVDWSAPLFGPRSKTQVLEEDGRANPPNSWLERKRRKDRGVPQAPSGAHPRDLKTRASPHPRSAVLLTKPLQRHSTGDGAFTVESIEIQFSHMDLWETLKTQVTV